MSVATKALADEIMASNATIANEVMPKVLAAYEADKTIDLMEESVKAVSVLWKEDHPATHSLKSVLSQMATGDNPFQSIDAAGDFTVSMVTECYSKGITGEIEMLTSLSEDDVARYAHASIMLSGDEVALIKTAKRIAALSEA